MQMMQNNGVQVMGEREVYVMKKNGYVMGEHGVLVMGEHEVYGR